MFSLLPLQDHNAYEVQEEKQTFIKDIKISYHPHKTFIKLRILVLFYKWTKWYLTWWRNIPHSEGRSFRDETRHRRWRMWLIPLLHAESAGPLKDMAGCVALARWHREGNSTASKGLYYGTCHCSSYMTNCCICRLKRPLWPQHFSEHLFFLWTVALLWKYLFLISFFYR